MAQAESPGPDGPIRGALIAGAILSPMFDARWFAIRRAQNRKPATYRCPLCHRHLPALSEHMLIVPEGDASRRRHAHTRCVLAAREAGQLPTREEWGRTQPRPPSRWRQLVRRVRRSSR